MGGARSTLRDGIVPAVAHTKERIPPDLLESFAVVIGEVLEQVGDELDARVQDLPATHRSKCAGNVRAR